MPLVRTLAKAQPWALFLVRVAIGVSMTYNGFEKIIPTGGLHRAHPLAGFIQFATYIGTLGLPPWLGYVSVTTEFVGGILLCLGLFTRFVALFVAINMVFALFLFNAHHGYSSSQYVLLLIAAALLLVTTGSGSLALDRRFGFS